jgi:hypothetical protein
MILKIDRKNPYIIVAKELDAIVGYASADKALLLELVSQDDLTTWANGKPISQAYLAWGKLRELGWMATSSPNKPGWLIWEFPENDIDKLELLLKHHDWYYMMSDDYRICSSGEKEHREILDLVKKIPNGEELYRRYSPK